MTLEPLQSLTTDLIGRTWTIAWNPNGTLLASGGSDKIIRIWAREGSDGTWSCSSKLADSHTKSIRRLSWSPCGRYLASASFDATICIWRRNLNDSSWSMSCQLEGHENEIKSVAWSHDGKFLASCGRDKTVWIWERTQDNYDNGSGDDAENQWDCSDVKNDHTRDVKHVVWHPSTNILASCSYDDSVKFFNLEGSDWKCFDTITDHKSTVWSADFSASGEFLVTCSDDKSIKIWKNHNHDKLPKVSSRSWICMTTLQGYHSRSVYDVSWCKMSDLIVSCSGDNSLVLYKRSDDPNDEGQFISISRYLDAHECDINSVAWNPRNVGLLASAGDDESIRLWNCRQDTQGMRLRPIVDEILEDLTYQFEKIDPHHVESECNQIQEYKTSLTDHNQFIKIVSNLQKLQDSLDDEDQDRNDIERLLGLKIASSTTQKPVIISQLSIDNGSGLVKNLSFDLNDRKKCVSLRYNLNVDESVYQLRIPKRAHRLLSVSDELFLIEKTGDIYRLNADGSCQFLLGHLFSITDFKLVISRTHQRINYIISADRDEKIRITNYPDTHRIERYAFGHEHSIRRLILVDSDRFISIDHDDTVCLWDLSKLVNLKNDEVFKPDRITSIRDTIEKRLRCN